MNVVEIIVSLERSSFSEVMEFDGEIRMRRLSVKQCSRKIHC